MCIERYVRLFAGTMVLASVLLAHLVSPWFLLIAVFVGLNLVQASLSQWCLLVNVLQKLRVPPCH
ncbi:MAG: DUF2892 domain-containing protein [Polyangiaceae bacterium]|nr:DUF2892 domain-containing protein [Polyangiaceae bacterium]